MNKPALRPPAILVLTGASGAGKTTLTLKLNELAIPGVKGINCDRVDIEVGETAGSSDQQAAILRYWISHFSQPETGVELAVLDTQIRPHVALAVLSEGAVDYAHLPGLANTLPNNPFADWRVPGQQIPYMYREPLNSSKRFRASRNIRRLPNHVPTEDLK